MSHNPQTNLTSYNRMATALVATFVIGAGGWGAVASLGSAIVAPATVIVSGKAKLVQHREGGLVTEIHVKEGSRVAAGTLVARLADTQPKAELGIQTGQLHTLVARLSRLTAEQRSAAEMSAAAAVGQDADSPGFALVMAGEKVQFDVRRQSRDGQKRQLAERIAQVEEQIVGRRQQLEARGREIATVMREVEDLRPLRARGLVTVARFNTIERSLFSLGGEEANIRSTIASSRAQIEEIRTQIANIDREHLTEVARDLRDTEDKLNEVREKLVATSDRLAKTEIRAPASGIVHQLAVTTIGGIAAPGETLMQIVPETSRLTLEARMERGDIDRVWPSQSVRVRFTSFDRRTTPELTGTVERIPADAETDAKTGVSFYRVEIALAPAEIARLGTATLRPGMPAETYIQTGDRTPLEYFVKPLKDQFARAFLER